MRVDAEDSKSMENSSMERRKDKRFSEKNKVFIKSTEEGLDNSAGLRTRAFTCDLSLGGARLISRKSYPVGTVVRIIMELARTNQVFQIDGEVKWVNKKGKHGTYEIGVEFLHNLSHTIVSLLRHLYSVGNGAACTPHATAPEAALKAEAPSLVSDAGK